MSRIKNFLYTGIIATMVLSSCSEEEYTPLSEKINNIVDSDTEVILSSETTSGTRASIESDDNGLFELPANSSLGVYMIAKETTDAGKELDIWWNFENHKVTYDGITYNDNWSVWIDNDPASVNYLYGEDGVTRIGNRIEWNGHKVHYYPYGYYHKYSFYGYYPYVNKDGDSHGVISRTKDQITVQYNNSNWLNGTQDIICGKAVSTQADAYSAKWARTHVGVYPNLALEHKLMKFDFIIKAGEKNNSYDEALQTRVKSIKIYNVPTYISMIVADKTNSANEGKLSYVRNQTSYFELKETNPLGTDQPLTAKYPTVEGISLGQGIMLPAIKSSETPYDLQIELEYSKDGSKHELVVPMRLDPKTITKNDTQFSDGEYHAGRAYQIVLTIHSPEEVGLSATLTPWVVVNDGNIIIQ